jgi:DNA-binding PadR family transcriptional regulator
MDGSTSFFWYAELSQIYTTLKKLEQEGLLVSSLESRSDRPDRRYYSILPAGQQALRNWLETPLLALEPHKETLLLKLFFSAGADRENLLYQLRRLRELHLKQLAIYEGETTTLIQQIADQFPQLAEDGRFWDATRRFGVMFEQLYIHWLDETIAYLAER